MSKNSRSSNNMPFAPVCAALRTSTEKESSVMINRCSTLNFGRSKHLRTDHTGALSQACIAYRRSSTGTARSNLVGTWMYTDIFFSTFVVLCTYRPCDEPTPAWGFQPNICKQDPERCIRSSDMWRWVTGYLFPDISRQYSPLISNSRNIQVTRKGKGSRPRCTVAPHRCKDPPPQKKKPPQIFLPTTVSYLWQRPGIISTGTPTSCSDARFPLLP
jgi:hypothetical protein